MFACHERILWSLLLPACVLAAAGCDPTYRTLQALEASVTDAQSGHPIGDAGVELIGKYYDGWHPELTESARTKAWFDRIQPKRHSTDEKGRLNAIIDIRTVDGGVFPGTGFDPEQDRLTGRRYLVRITREEAQDVLTVLMCPGNVERGAHFALEVISIGKPMLTASNADAAAPIVALPAETPETRNSLPVILITHKSGNPGRDPAGVEVAIWDDGLVLFARDCNAPGSDLCIGAIEPSRVSDAISQLTKAGFFNIRPSAYLVPDGHKVTMATRLGATYREHSWDEVTRMGHGANKLFQASEYMRFKKMWEKSRRVIGTCCPTESQSAEAQLCEGGQIRGLHVGASTTGR